MSIRDGRARLAGARADYAVCAIFLLDFGVNFWSASSWLRYLLMGLARPEVAQTRATFALRSLPSARQDQFGPKAVAGPPGGSHEFIQKRAVSAALTDPRSAGFDYHTHLQ